MGLLDECVHDRFGVLACHSHERDVARLAFHQRRDLAVVTAEEQVALPVARHRPVLCLGRTFADRHRLGDPAMIGRLLRVMARTAHPAGASQVLQQLFLQGTAGLDEECAINRLVGHLARLVLRIRALEPPGHLVRRPLELQLVGHDTRQRRVLREFTALRALRPVPCRLIRSTRSVRSPAAVAA